VVVAVKIETEPALPHTLNVSDAASVSSSSPPEPAPAPSQLLLPHGLAELHMRCVAVKRGTPAFVRASVACVAPSSSCATVRRADRLPLPSPTPSSARPCVRSPSSTPSSTRPSVRVMVRTESKDVEVGAFRLPAFTLPEPATGGAVASTDGAAAPATVVIFYAPHCPFVKLLKDALAAFAAEYAPRGVRILAVCSSSQQTHPQDGPAALAGDAAAMPGIHFLFDADQAVAKAFMAACTPEFYVFDGAGTLAYHGQACDARPKQDPPAIATARDLRAAVGDVLAGRLPVLGGAPQKRALGCNIKFTPGNEPDYFRTTF